MSLSLYLITGLHFLFLAIVELFCSLRYFFRTESTVNCRYPLNDRADQATCRRRCPSPKCMILWLNLGSASLPIGLDFALSTVHRLHFPSSIMNGIIVLTTIFLASLYRGIKVPSIVWLNQNLNSRAIMMKMRREDIGDWESVSRRVTCDTMCSSLP